MGSVVQAVVVGAGLLVAAGLVHQIRERAKFELLAEQKQAVIDDLNAKVEMDSLALVEVVEWAEDSLATLREAAADAEERIASWRSESRKTQASLNTIINTLPDTLQERVNSVVESLVAQHREEVEGYELLTLNLRNQNNVVNDQLLATQKLNTSLHKALAEANGQIDFYRSAASPSFFKSIKGNLPKLAAAVAFGYGIAQVTN